MALICGLGAVTPIGRNVWSSAAAVRAGLTGFAQHPVMTDVEGRPLQVACYPWLLDAFTSVARIAGPLVEAIRQALEPVLSSFGAHGRPNIHLLVNLPIARPGLSGSLVDQIQRHIEAAFPRTFDGIGLAQRGHAGGLLALKSATSVLESGKASACVVAGADSSINLETLEWLEETDQLHGAGAKNNAWGFVPGEGAGAVLLMRHDVAQAASVKILARVLSVGVDVEKCLIRTDSVCLGLGLTGAFRDAFAPLVDGQLVSDTYCDMNGEPYRADEYGFAVTRTREHFTSPSEFVAPADCWGDTGAASAPLAVSLATIAFLKAYANGNLSLVWGSSDTGERGAALIVAGG